MERAILIFDQANEEVDERVKVAEADMIWRSLSEQYSSLPQKPNLILRTFLTASKEKPDLEDIPHCLKCLS